MNKILSEKWSRNLPLDCNLAGANSALVVLANIHVASIPGQVGQVQGAVGVLSRHIDATVVVTEGGALGKLN